MPSRTVGIGVVQPELGLTGPGSTFSAPASSGRFATFGANRGKQPDLNRPAISTSTSATLQTILACTPLSTQPVAGPDLLSTASGTPLVITPAQLLANDTDPQSLPLQVASVTRPSSGTLVTNPDGTFTYTPDAGFVGTATFTYLLQLAGPVLASAATGHYYEFVAAPNICWTAAQTAAAARTYNGMTGYLATITTSAETAFLADRNANQYWFGAADDVVEGEWRWKTGPEAGQLIWQGGPSGTPVSYAHWSPGEPNDYQNQFVPNGQDFGLLYAESGLWDDVADCIPGGGNVTGYVVEYGGLEACLPVLFATGTVTITVGQASASAAARGAAAVLEAAPNPTDGRFEVRVLAASGGPAQLDLFDLRGRHVRSLFAGTLQAGKQQEIPVDVLDLAPGIYLVRLQSSQRVQYLRVLIQK